MRLAQGRDDPSQLKSLVGIPINWLKLKNTCRQSLRGYFGWPPDYIWNSCSRILILRQTTLKKNVHRPCRVYLTGTLTTVITNTCKSAFFKSSSPLSPLTLCSQSFLKLMPSTKILLITQYWQNHITEENPSLRVACIHHKNDAREDIFHNTRDPTLNTKYRSYLICYQWVALAK